MPLNQSKPPLSFLLHAAFAVLFSLRCPLPPRVTGVRQTCCVQVRACVSALLCADEHMNARVGVSGRSLF